MAPQAIAQACAASSASLKPQPADPRGSRTSLAADDHLTAVCRGYAPSPPRPPPSSARTNAGPVLAETNAMSDAVLIGWAAETRLSMGALATRREVRCSCRCPAGGGGVEVVEIMGGRCGWALGLAAGLCSGGGGGGGGGGSEPSPSTCFAVDTLSPLWRHLLSTIFSIAFPPPDPT